MSNPAKLLFSAGGTGGHILPAIAVADAILKKWPDTVIHFAGAEGRMEMEKVPAQGYEITGLPVMGLQRNATFRNLSFPLKLIRSLRKAQKLISTFSPDAVVGFGGYASGPVLLVAQWKRIPTFLQEQNAYPGITNKWLAKKAEMIFTAYSGMEKFFPEKKIVVSGNPIRSAFFATSPDKSAAVRHFGFDPRKPVMFFMGGSQGARAINQAIAHNLQFFIDEGIQIIWQTGKPFYEEAQSLIREHGAEDVIKPYIFIDDIHTAYTAATLMVARAGAISIAELSAAGKACIFVPLPTAAEDHQRKNAQRLVDADAGEIIDNSALSRQLPEKVAQLLASPQRIRKMENNVQGFAHPGASEKIAEMIMQKITG